MVSVVEDVEIAVRVCGDGAIVQLVERLYPLVLAAQGEDRSEGPRDRCVRAEVADDLDADGVRALHGDGAGGIGGAGGKERCGENEIPASVEQWHFHLRTTFPFPVFSILTSGCEGQSFPLPHAKSHGRTVSVGPAGRHVDVRICRYGKRNDYRARLFSGPLSSRRYNAGVTARTRMVELVRPPMRA